MREAFYIRMADLVLIVSTAVSICLLIAAMAYVDLVEYAYPALGEVRLKKKVFPFAGIFC